MRHQLLPMSTKVKDAVLKKFELFRAKFALATEVEQLVRGSNIP